MTERQPLTSARFIIAALILVTASVYPRAAASAQQLSQVGLVIDFGDSHIVRCIEFDGPEIEGDKVLERAELELVVNFDSGMGAGICSIGGKGCPASSCLTCDVPNYWSYWHLEGESWVYSQHGASSYSVHSGDVEGWRWGTGDPPPVIPFDQICAPPATDTPVPTDTPIPPTSTPVPPTQTPIPKPEVWFRLDDNPIASGTCTVLRWDTSNAQEVYLDGEPVSMVGSREVCPTTPTHYKLRIVGAEHEETAELTLGVTGPTPTPTESEQQTTPLPSRSRTVEALTTTQVTPSLTNQVTASPTPSPTSRPESSSTPEPDESPSPLPSPSATAGQIAQAGRTATPVPTVATEGAQEQADGPHESGPASSLTLASYIVFSLIVGGLTGWLIYALKFRR